MTRERAIEVLKAWDLNWSDEFTANEFEQAFAMAISALSENKGDLISRQAVDDAIYDYSRSCDVNYAQIMEYIDKIPSVENKGEWIPCSERLPEMGVRVLCACQADLYDVLKLTPNGWFYDTRHTYMLGFVRAWQPLPEPYKAEKGGE